MSMPVISLEEFDRQYETLRDKMDADLYQKLCGTAVAVPGAEKLSGLQPFSDAYREEVLRFHATLRRSESAYDAGQHEQADPGHFSGANVFTDTMPWQFKDVSFLSQHVYSWAAIFAALDLKGAGRVLEYGPGSGQILLQLARCGIDAYAVDIDQRWLDQITRQAEVMGLHVNVERNVFGKGFEGVTFDRIIFFEAFHHAIDFLEVLSALRSRLTEDGMIVFCGEPILGGQNAAVPYPWGPRLDGAALWCTRSMGWMELGFTHECFTQALARTGYVVEYRPLDACARASCYIARPARPGQSIPRPPQRRSSLRRKIAKFFSAR